MELSQGTLLSNKLFEDVFDGNIPDRVPNFLSADNAFCLEYAGFDLKKEQYSIEKNIVAFDKTTADFDTDVCFGTYIRPAHMYKILGAKNFVPGTDGFIQHPEVHGLEASEYDELISDPVKTIWSKVLPRIYTEFGKGGFAAQKALSKSFFTFYATFGQIAQGSAEISNKYGRSLYSMAAGVSSTPFDVLSDQLRSFTGVSSDVRRVPDKVVAACEALLPLSVKAGILPNSDRYNRTFIPLHMGPYMREKDFQKFYWPTFKAYVEALDNAGVGANIFVEQDWMRYLDYLNELPKGTCFIFEYGDPKLVKEKLGQRHVISGFYPLGMLKNSSEKQCLDKAKELIDILAPSGNFIFCLDKSLLRVNDVDCNNLKALCSFVKEYGKY